MFSIASDHAGFNLKEKIKEYLKSTGMDCKDYGTDSTQSVDYPVFAEKVCLAINSGESDRGILVCGTGIGISMAANKYPGIRAACCSDTFSARMSRLHNDANVLCIGERVIGEGLACDIVKIFLETPFEGGKHIKRINMFKL